MEDIGKLILRVTTAGLILFHGMAKLQHGISFILAGITAHPLPEFMAYGVFIGEVIAPLFILAGLWTRVAARGATQRPVLWSPKII
jgi:putative oxidoreductase